MKILPLIPTSCSLVWFVFKCHNSQAAVLRPRRFSLRDKALLKICNVRGGGEQEEDDDDGYEERTTFINWNPQLRYKYDMQYIKQLDAYIDFLIALYDDDGDDSFTEASNTSPAQNIMRHYEEEEQSQLEDDSQSNNTATMDGDKIHLHLNTHVSDSEDDLNQYVDFLLETTHKESINMNPDNMSTATTEALFVSDNGTLHLAAELSGSTEVERDHGGIRDDSNDFTGDDSKGDILSAVELDEYVDRMVSTVLSDQDLRTEPYSGEEDSVMDGYIETLDSAHVSGSMGDANLSLTNKREKAKMDKSKDFMAQTMPIKPQEVAEDEEEFHFSEAAVDSATDTDSSEPSTGPTNKIINQPIPTEERLDAKDDEEVTLDDRPLAGAKSKESETPSDHDDDDDNIQDDSGGKFKVSRKLSSAARGAPSEHTILAKPKGSDNKTKQQDPARVSQSQSLSHRETKHPGLDVKADSSGMIGEGAARSGEGDGSNSEMKPKEGRANKKKKRKEKWTVSQFPPQYIEIDGPPQHNGMLDASERIEDTSPGGSSSVVEEAFRARPPNGLYRFLLRKGHIGHVICLAIVMLVEWVQVYIPQFADFLAKLFLNIAPAKLQRRLAPRLVDGDVSLSASSLQQQYSGRMPVKGKQRKMLSKRADQEALAQLKRIRDIQDAKYKHVSLDFIKRHGLGQFRDRTGSQTEDDDRVEDTALVSNKPVRTERKTAIEKYVHGTKGKEEDSDVEWILKGLTKQPRKTKNSSKSRVGPSLSIGMGSAGSSVEVGLEFDSGNGRSKTYLSRPTVQDRKLLVRDALAHKTVRKKSTPRSSDRDGGNGVMGRLRAAATANNVMSRSLLGAYPGDVVSPGAAASAKGVKELAEKYGYGDWSSDDDSDSGDSKIDKGLQKKRRKHKKKKSSISTRSKDERLGFDGTFEKSPAKIRQFGSRKQRMERRKSSSKIRDDLGITPSLQELKGLESDFTQSGSERSRKAQMIRPVLGRLDEMGSRQPRVWPKKSSIDNSELRQWFDKSGGVANRREAGIRPALHRDDIPAAGSKTTHEQD